MIIFIHKRDTLQIMVTNKQQSPHLRMQVESYKKIIRLIIKLKAIINVYVLAESDTVSSEYCYIYAYSVQCKYLNSYPDLTCIQIYTVTGTYTYMYISRDSYL